MNDDRIASCVTDTSSSSYSGPVFFMALVLVVFRVFIHFATLAHLNIQSFQRNHKIIKEKS